MSLLFAFFLSAGLSLLSQELYLSTDDLSGKIQFSVYGNSESSHYRRPLKIDLKNISPEKQSVKIEPGQILFAEEDHKQNFVVVQGVTIELLPGEQMQYDLRAMCIERYDAAPVENSIYRPGPMADSALMALVKMISENQHFNYEAQTAVWAMVGDYRLKDIVGFDTCLTRNLMEFVAGVRGEELPPPPAPDDYSRNYYTPVRSFKYTITSTFEYTLLTDREVTIAMFDENNIVVRELYKNDSCSPGRYEMEFKFDATEYTDEYYYVRLLENGEIMLELMVETPEEIRRG